MRKNGRSLQRPRYTRLDPARHESASGEAGYSPNRRWQAVPAWFVHPRAVYATSYSSIVPSSISIAEAAGRRSPACPTEHRCLPACADWGVFSQSGARVPPRDDGPRRQAPRRGDACDGARVLGLTPAAVTKKAWSGSPRFASRGESSCGGYWLSCRSFKAATCSIESNRSFLSLRFSVSSASQC